MVFKPMPPPGLSPLQRLRSPFCRFQEGNTYVFAITAEADGTSLIETSQFRSSLPTGFANVVSAPITISSGALTPAIHGDRRVITRLSQAPRNTPH